MADFKYQNKDNSSGLERKAEDCLDCLDCCLSPMTVCAWLTNRCRLVTLSVITGRKNNDGTGETLGTAQHQDLDTSALITQPGGLIKTGDSSVECELGGM